MTGKGHTNARRYILVAAAFLAVIGWLAGTGGVADRAKAGDPLPVDRVTLLIDTETDRRWTLYTQAGIEDWPTAGTFVVSHWGTDGKHIKSVRMRVTATIVEPDINPTEGARDEGGQ